MSERKVLNKYYPPDFDPSKIPKLRLPRNRQYSIRIMAPFNMRCNTCGEYVYKGKKFNSRKETVEDEEYLGLKIFRFYIKCPRCVAEIAFKTDPQNTDYALEGGATRNFEAMRTAEMLARKEVEEKEQEEANNPMKVLENRTKQSQQEMEMIETLEELRELNSRHAKVDTDDIVKLHAAYEEQLSKLQDEEDEKFIKEVFGKGSKDESVKRLQDDEEDDDSLEAPPPLKKAAFSQNPTDFLTQGSESTKKASSSSTADSSSKMGAWGRGSSSAFTSKSALAGLVRRKQPTPGGATSDVTKASTPQTTPGGATEQTVKGTTSMGPPMAPGTNKSSNLIGAPPQAGKEANPGKGLVNGVGGKVESTVPKVAALPTGLGLLGAYSDSDSNSDNDSS